MSGATLERRLANYRATLAASGADPGDRRDGGVGMGSIELGRRLAAAVDGELLLDPAGPVVRCEPATVVLPLASVRVAHAMLAGERPRPRGKIVLRVAQEGDGR